MTTETSQKQSDPFYSPSHPWYYVLGGYITRPSMIRQHVKQRGYQGYRDDIDDQANKPEPVRSENLRRIRASLLAELRDDLSRYRQLAVELYRHRDKPEQPDLETACEDVHMNLSLKYNHLFNDFAHLLKVDELLSEQPDLFDF